MGIADGSFLQSNFLFDVKLPDLRVFSRNSSWNLMNLCDYPDAAEPFGQHVGVYGNAYFSLIELRRDSDHLAICCGHQ